MNLLIQLALLTTLALSTASAHAQGPAPMPAPLAPPPESAQPAPPIAQAAPARTPTAAGHVPLSLVSAVQTALRRHPALVTARGQLELARAQWVSAQSPLDVTLNSSFRHSRTHNRAIPSAGQPASVFDSTTLNLGLGTNLRWGTGVRATVGLRRDDTRLRPSVPDLELLPTHTALTQLEIIQPLLRGAGNYGASSQIYAAEHALRAAELTLAHAAQLQAFDVIAAYWELVGAGQALTLAEASRTRAQRMLEETQVLVDADQRPRGDLRALEAGFASRLRDAIEAERLRVRALHTLRLAMGLEVSETADWDPLDSFPAPGLPPLAASELASRAASARRDLRAAEASVSAAAAAERGADHNTLPKLDLELAVGYTGGLESTGVGPFFDALGRNIEGVNASAGVSFEVPLENSAAQGERASAAARRTLAETARDDLARTIRSNVLAAYDELRAEVQALDAANAAERGYAQALDDERAKLRAGLATVLDTIIVEDLWTNATRARIATELALSLALARLRLELGALPSSDTTAPRALAGVLHAGVVE